MTKLDIALEECLEQLRTGDATLEECLQKYPDLQDELRPLLAAASQLQVFSEFKPRPEFRSQTRAMLNGYMRASPRQRTGFGSGFLRLATSAAIIFVALTTTSAALAQQAVPGDALYPVKLTTEKVWRSLQKDQVSADAFLANRRVEELQAVQGHAELEQMGVALYAETLKRLRDALHSNPEQAGWVSQLLVVQKESLQELFATSQADLPDPEEIFNIVLNPLNGILPSDLLPTPTPTGGLAPQGGSAISNPAPAQGESVIPTLLPLPKTEKNGSGEADLGKVIQPLVEPIIEPIKGLLDSLFGN